MQQQSPYKALAQDEIRVLYVLPGNPEDILQCSFAHHSLVTAKPLYTAISYTWGPLQDPSPSCVVDGIALPIRQNAFRILTYLRQLQGVARIWIDCLCINQDDVLEKNVQIPLMCSIYKHAVETVIWLGDSADKTGDVTAYIESIDANDIYHEFESGWVAPWRSLHKTFILEMLEKNPRKEFLVNGIARLLLAEYFTRVWIRQEAAMGGNPRVLWGAHVIDWKHIAVLAWIFRTPVTMDWPDWTDFPYDKLESATETILSVNARRTGLLSWQEDGLTSREATPLYGQLVWARSGLSTIAHDKIFALISICSDIHRERQRYATQVLTIDYNLSWQEVYVAAARFFTFDQNVAEWQFLNVAGLQNLGVNSDLPSWVPDWRYPERIGPVALDDWASGGKRSSVRTKISQLSRKERSLILRYAGYTSIGTLLEPLPRDRCQATSTDEYQFLGPKQVLPENLTCADSACKDKLSKSDYNYLLSASRAAVALHVQVSMQDRLTYLSRTSSWWYDVDIPQYRREILSIDNENLKFLKEQSMADRSNYITDESLVIAYNTTIICNQDASSKKASPDLIASANDWRAWLKDDNIDHYATRSSMPYHGAIETAFSFREYVFGYTASGYMCLLPPFAKLGDEIVVINGYVVPFVVRPVVQDWYMLIGQCYVHGMMTSKASELIEEFSIKVDDKSGQTVIRRPEGDVRANGKKMNHGGYTTILHTLGVRWLKLI